MLLQNELVELSCKAISDDTGEKKSFKSIVMCQSRELSKIVKSLMMNNFRTVLYQINRKMAVYLFVKKMVLNLVYVMKKTVSL